MFNCCVKSLLLFILLVLIIACSHFYSMIEVLDHRYYVDEPDAYMHLVIASDVLKHHDWYQHFNYRINAPYGADTHAWTHVISAMLVGGAFLIGFFRPSAADLYIWSFVLPMIFNAVAACAMLWSVRPLKPTFYQRLFILIAFLLNPFINSYFVPLRVDYDFFLLTLSIVYWGCCLRWLLTNSRYWVFATGVIACLGMWTSISFVLLVLVNLAFFIGLSIHKKHCHFGAIRKFLVVLCCALVFIIPFEHRQFFTISYDIISVVYVAFFFLLWVSLLLYERCLFHLKPLKKIPLLIVLMLFNAFLMNNLFPGFYLGPYNQIDPYLLKYFFPVVSEFYSPFNIDSALTIALLYYFIVGIGFCYYLYLDNKSNVGNALFSPDKIQSDLIGFILWAAMVMTALALYMYRWNEFAAPLNILLTSFFIAQVDKKKMALLANGGLVITMAIMPAAILLLTRNYTPQDLQRCREQYHTMINDGFLDKQQFSQDKIIFVESNYGPLMLYSTHYSIIATNDHHNSLGIKDSFNFFKEDESAARNMMMQRDVDLVLLCKAKRPTGFDIDSRQWLNPIPLPEAYSQWELYRVIHED